jgi:hypothetical protein
MTHGKVGLSVRTKTVASRQYADDILILAPTATELQRLLSACECELNWLDMAINVKKNLVVSV